MRRSAWATPGPLVTTTPGPPHMSLCGRKNRIRVPPVPSVQIKDLNSGTFGFVQLARDKQTGETWAVKFIER